VNSRRHGEPNLELPQHSPLPTGEADVGGEDEFAARTQRATLRAPGHGPKPPYNVPHSVIETMHRATAELIESRAARRAKKAGDLAPSFSLKDPEGISGQSQVRFPVGVRNGIGMPATGSLLFIFVGEYRASSRWYSCWYRQQCKKKSVFNSIGYGIKRLSARGTTHKTLAITTTYNAGSIPDFSREFGQLI
jgi:hypothetical protein